MKRTQSLLFRTATRSSLLASLILVVGCGGGDNSELVVPAESDASTDSASDAPSDASPDSKSDASDGSAGKGGSGGTGGAAGSAGAAGSGGVAGAAGAGGSAGSAGTGGSGGAAGSSGAAGSGGDAGAAGTSGAGGAAGSPDDAGLPDASDADIDSAIDSPDDTTVASDAEPDSSVDSSPDALADVVDTDSSVDSSIDASLDALVDGASDAASDATSDVVDSGMADVPCGGCPSGQVCLNDQCVPNSSCKTDNDCSNDLKCDTISGTCVAWTLPASDGDCLVVAPPGVFSPSTKCEFSAPPAGDPFPNHRDVQATPVVVKFGAQNYWPSIVVPFTATVVNSYTETLGIVRVLSGRDCSLEANLGGVDVDADGGVDWIRSSSPVAAADLDGDGIAEVIAYGADSSTLAFTRKAGVWSLLWKARKTAGGAPFIGLANPWAGPSVYDLDDDGKPEVVRGGSVISSTGILVRDIPSGYTTYSQGLDAVMANFDSTPGIELTNGQYIWEYAATQWVQKATLAAGSGYTAVADFGAYGGAGVPATNPEIVVVRGGTVAIYANNGTVVMAPIAVPGGGGGNPTVADYDGDGLPEVGVAGADYYTVYDIDCTSSPRPGGSCTKNTCDSAATCPAGILWNRKTQDHSSNITSSSVFDFEADGKSEVVYADECFTRVYRGTDGAVIFSQYRSSCTWNETPIIADVDGNYRADLVVPSNLACSNGTSGIACGGLNSDGVDAQFAGLVCKNASDCVSGVCDNGLCRCTATSQCCKGKTDAACTEMGFKCSAPPTGTAGTGNTCRASHPHGVQGIRVYSDASDMWVRSRMIWNQAAYAVTHVGDNGDVPRTSLWKNNWEQPGLNNFRQNVPGTANSQATADPTVSGIGDWTCGAQGATLTARACNRGANDLGAGLVVGFFDGSTQLCAAQTTAPISVGQCEDVSCVWAGVPTSKSSARNVSLVADLNNSVAECKEGNNKGTIYGVYCPAP